MIGSIGKTAAAREPDSARTESKGLRRTGADIGLKHKDALAEHGTAEGRQGRAQRRVAANEQRFGSRQLAVPEWTAQKQMPGGALLEHQWQTTLFDMPADEMLVVTLGVPTEIAPPPRKPAFVS